MLEQPSTAVQQETFAISNVLKMKGFACDFPELIPLKITRDDHSTECHRDINS
jgi:hypothetical protein